MKTRSLWMALLVWAGLLAGCAQELPVSPDFSDPAYRWMADLSFPGEDRLVRGQEIDHIMADLDQLIYAVNGSDQDPESFRTPEGQEPLGPPKLKLLEIRGKQAVVEVINALYLTQRMGSTGADAFLAEATYTLTEHPDIEEIYFQFEEGDHARPGLYTRDNFLTHWIPVQN